jgi:hypothetical protein
MGVSGQLHKLAALPLGEDSPVPIGENANLTVYILIYYGLINIVYIVSRIFIIWQKKYEGFVNKYKI